MPDTLTDFIKNDLKARLVNRTGLPDKLTLSALSQLYQVSFTPVRLAVLDLIDEEVLCKQPNGRLVASTGSNPARRKKADLVPAPRPGDTSGIESALIKMILTRGLRGETDYLREEATAEELHIGRTVLRQILNRLAGKGLLEHLPRRGWRIRPFEEPDMAAYLRVRERLELEALDLARPYLEPAELKHLLQGNRAAARGTGERLDNNLHRYLIEKAGNRYIKDFFDRHGLYYATLFDFAAPEARVVRAMARQHCQILQALLARDWAQARRALAHHIRSQRPVMNKLLKQLGSRPHD